jgi:hypothetical protein
MRVDALRDAPRFTADGADPRWAYSMCGLPDVWGAPRHPSRIEPSFIE